MLNSCALLVVLLNHILVLKDLYVLDSNEARCENGCTLETTLPIDDTYFNSLYVLFAIWCEDFL